MFFSPSSKTGYILGCAILTLFSSAASADDIGKSQTAASYLWLAPSARAQAMGNSFVGAGNDASAIYYNPAGLAQPVNSSEMYTEPPQRHEMLFTSSVMGLDRSHYFFGYVYSFTKKNSASSAYALRRPFTPMGIGLGIISFGIRGIEGYDVFGNRGSDFNDSENAFLLSYGANIYDNFSLGISYKGLLQNMSDGGAGGWAFDLGALYRLNEDLSLGLSIRNLMGQLKWQVSDPAAGTSSEYSEQVAMNTILGSSYRLTPRVALFTDVEFADKQNLDWHIGSEYDLTPMSVLRAGLDGYNPTIGFGINTDLPFLTLFINYAFKIDTAGLGSVHQFSLNTKFNFEKTGSFDEKPRQARDDIELPDNPKPQPTKDAIALPN
jgi:hypothetical protein